ncbi:hypothetical protein M427DRAFT_236218 [Gonapodya prolifera JEL478]|uniref:FATC domain-containing protein n=1 Tax=Gonapodya prolifera (strain JEL478) TaxID=1344416 RepID=A0A139AN66_GONPJ|nr:hypothetical protein M427DRAFT_236218 [Gonapodya prolifera JEL478]|eukprot:KXS17963.1 hypothetical protein M427DRAFT_236218 [Gonapodya prolifera JEL478]
MMLDFQPLLNAIYRISSALHDSAEDVSVKVQSLNTLYNETIAKTNQLFYLLKNLLDGDMLESPTSIEGIVSDLLTGFEGVGNRLREIVEDESSGIQDDGIQSYSQASSQHDEHSNAENATVDQDVGEDEDDENLDSAHSQEPKGSDSNLQSDTALQPSNVKEEKDTIPPAWTDDDERENDREKLSQRPHIERTRKRAPHLLAEARKAYAVHVLRRVRRKLEGRDPHDDRKSSVEEQVAYIIDEATSVANLARMYEGWTGWI